MARIRRADYSRLSDSRRLRATSGKAAIYDSVLCFEFPHSDVPYTMAGAVLPLPGARSPIFGFVVIYHAAYDSRPIVQNSAGPVESRWSSGYDLTRVCHSY